MKIVISSHAITRFRERFRLFFNPIYFTNNAILLGLIEAQFKSAHPVIKWKQSPFYNNKEYSKHGNIDVYRNGPIFFIVVNKKNKLIIKTVIHKWVYVGEFE